MPLYIRDDEVRSLAQRVADARHLTVTEAVRRALARELAEIEQDVARRRAAIAELHAEWAKHPPIQEWGDEQMYDEDGVPK